MQPMNDEKPLFSPKHETQEGWGFRISRFEWINTIFGFFYMLFHRPKFNESNLEKVYIHICKENPCPERDRECVEIFKSGFQAYFTKNLKVNRSENATNDRKI